MKDIVHELEKIIWGVLPIVNYRGCLVEKLIGGYRVLNETVITPSQVDEAINKSLKILGDSIVVVNDGMGGMATINTETPQI